LNEIHIKLKNKVSNVQKLPPNVLQSALDDLCRHENMVLNMVQFQNKLRNNGPNLDIYRSVDFDAQWNKANPESEPSSLSSPVMESSSSGASIKGGTEGEGEGEGEGDSDDEDDADGDDNESKLKLRTCTVTLKQIIRPSFLQPIQSTSAGSSSQQNNSRYNVVANEIKAVQRDVTKVMEEVSVLVDKIVLLVRKVYFPSFGQKKNKQLY
jgi:hypothetical protein